MEENIKNNNDEQNEITTQTQTEVNTGQKQKEQSVDIEKVKNDAVSEYVKSLGVESGEKLQDILKKVKEDEDKNKSELERTGDTLKETTRQLAEEREARQLSDAKLAAIKLGANPKLVDDLVVIAKARVTNDKKIEEVIAEIKDGETGNIYFGNEEDEKGESKGKKKEKTKNVTRKSQTKKEDETEDNEENKYVGSMAERIFAKKKKVKSSYFSN